MNPLRQLWDVARMFASAFHPRWWGNVPRSTDTYWWNGQLVSSAEADDLERLTKWDALVDDALNLANEGTPVFDRLTWEQQDHHFESQFDQ